MNENEDLLDIRMLGGFVLTWQGRKITLGRNGTAKFIQLLQMIWLQGESGLDKITIVRNLYDIGELSNPDNSFNNLVFQMRRQMAAAGLPKRDYIVREGKKYVPDPSVKIRVDTEEFRRLIREAGQEKNEEQRFQRYQKALALYQGELLPESASVPFVVQQSTQLCQLFEQAIVFCGDYAKQRQDYDTMYRVYEKAAGIYADNGWQAYQIEALICKGQYERAYTLYDQTIHMYSTRMGLSPSKKMLENYAMMSQKLTAPTGELHQIQSALQEDPVSGAYFCSYPSFIDMYHVLERNMERSGRSVFLLLCTLVDYEGRPFRSKERLEKRSAALREAISGCLRKGDIFTKYNDSQYLVLLVGSNREGCDLVGDRISQRYREKEGTKASIRYSNVSLAQLAKGGEREQ